MIIPEIRPERLKRDEQDREDNFGISSKIKLLINRFYPGLFCPSCLSIKIKQYKNYSCELPYYPEK